MKKMMIALTMMLLTAATGMAMSYEQARNEALFLTDKMAYELNLTDEQYEAAYEINLDYLMGVTSYDDVFGTYWERRNLDLSYVLLDWQWQTFCAASYFYRPLYWRDGFWHFGIYARYPHRDYFYFGRPVFYASYRGGHAWHIVGGRGYYYSRRDHFHHIGGRSHFGMLDRWNRGDYRHHHNGSYGHHNNYGSRDNRLGGNRNSSTRNTVNGRHEYSNGNHSSREYNNGNHGTSTTTSRQNGGSLGGYRSSHGNMGGSSSNSNSTTTSRPTISSGRTTITNSRPSATYSRPSISSSRPSVSSSRPSVRSSRQSVSSSGSFGGSRSSGSFSSGATRSSGSFSSHSSGAGRSAGGGHSYGGRR